jgi:hypothetical protein
MNRAGEYAGNAAGEAGKGIRVTGASGRVEFCERQRSHETLLTWARVPVRHSGTVTWRLAGYGRVCACSIHSHPARCPSAMIAPHSGQTR